mmetsp:Transcript_23687/g.48020  ORF Transcript_23687/g.48020 Transcript_23687/m.48020 type:complete len:238 (-) Transcript_23687:1138-1851(-)
MMALSWGNVMTELNMASNTQYIMVKKKNEARSITVRSVYSIWNQRRPVMRPRQTDLTKLRGVKMAEREFFMARCMRTMYWVSQEVLYLGSSSPVTSSPALVSSLIMLASASAWDLSMDSALASLSHNRINAALDPGPVDALALWFLVSRMRLDRRRSMDLRRSNRSRMEMPFSRALCLSAAAAPSSSSSSVLEPETPAGASSSSLAPSLASSPSSMRLAECIVSFSSAESTTSRSIQ